MSFLCNEFFLRADFSNACGRNSIVEQNEIKTFDEKFRSIPLATYTLSMNDEIGIHILGARYIRSSVKSDSVIKSETCITKNIRSIKLLLPDMV